MTPESKHSCSSRVVLESMLFVLVVQFGISSSAANAQNALPYGLDFDGIPAGTSIAPGVGTTLLGSGIDLVLSTGGRARVLATSTLGIGPPPSASGNGPEILVLDRAAVGTLAVNTLVIHFDGTNTADGLVIRVSLFDFGDESHSEDFISLGDGVTPGPGTTASGLPATTPGYLGFKEVRLLDWTSVDFGGGWRSFDFVVDAAFLVANGLVSSSSMFVRFQQADDFPAPSDGLGIDAIRIEALLPQFGQAPRLGVGTLDINEAVEINGLPVSSLRNGPYSAHVTPGMPIEFSIQGAANQPIILAAGDLAVGLASFGAFGQVDIGTAGMALPAGVVIIADGVLQTGFLGQIFRTAGDGTFVFTIGSSGLPLPFTTTFQAVVYTGGPVPLAFTNAVTLEIP